MTISVGNPIPEIELRTMTAEGPKPISSIEALGTGTVVLFAVPGAFTPTCSERHFPGFVLRADELKQKGADHVACISVNDAFVMAAWGASQNAAGSVELLADGNGDFTRAVGLEADLHGGGLGMRSRRYAAIVRDGIVTYLGVEEAPGVTVSSAEAVLAALEA